MAMAMVAIGFLLLWLSVYGCVRGLGQSLDCASGFIDRETLTARLQIRGLPEQRQWIMPDLNFTCSGTVTKLIFAARWYNRRSLHPDLQIWRPNGNGTYTKMQSSKIDSGRLNRTNRYEYNLKQPLEFHAGDIIGILQPSQAMIRFYMQHYPGNSQIMSYYLETDTSQFQDFSTFGEEVKRMSVLPLLTVEVETNSSIRPQECISRFSSEEMIMMGLGNLTIPIGTRNQAQRIIPNLRFDCDGAVTKWIVGAYWSRNGVLFPDLQLWRRNESGVYNQVGNTTLTTRYNASWLYEFAVDPSLPFQRGDILGIFQPSGSQSRLRIVYRTGSENSTNYVFNTAENVTEPPLSIFSTSSADVTLQLVLPFVTVEISRSMSAVTLPPLTPTDNARLPETSSTAEVFPTSFPLPMQTFTGRVERMTLTDHLSSYSSKSVLMTSIDVTTQETVPELFTMTSRTTLSSPLPSVLFFTSGYGTMQPSVSVLTVGTVAGVGGTFLLAVIIVVFVLTVLLLFRRRKKKYSVSTDTDEHILQNPLYGDQGQVDALPVGSTKTSKTPELNANGACGSPSKDSEYELVRGRGASENTEFNFSNPLYAEPERVIACEIYESSNLDAASLEWGFCVPTEEQRRKLSSLSESDLYSTVYSDVNVHPAKEPKEQVFFQESNIYWAPSSNPTELYAQLAKYKFREILSLQIKTTDHLGSGQFGSVDKGVWTSPNGQVEVAVKQLKEGTSEADRVKFLKEAAIMGQFQHPNVIKLHGVVTMAEPAMIILEFMSNGDLRDYLIKNRPSPGEMTTPETPKLCLKFCHQVASGMEYLAGKAFVHRDLAARNILVSAERNCKIADFGMARDLEESEYYISQGGKVPVKWTAPEAISFKKYSTASDVWSFGALLFEIWSLGHKPFEEYTNLEVLRLVGDGYRLSPPPGCPKAIYKLMTNCWHPDPVARPTFSELYQALSQPESELLGWSEEDMRVHPQAAVLGAPLEAGKDLYLELQERHISRDD